MSKNRMKGKQEIENLALLKFQEQKQNFNVSTRIFKEFQ